MFPPVHQGVVSLLFPMSEKLFHVKENTQRTSFSTLAMIGLGFIVENKKVIL
jgi:hypothetical protein